MADPTQKSSLELAQFDEALKRALPGGAIDKALSEKAPAGYGYGEAIRCYNFTADYSAFTNALDSVLSGMKPDEVKQILVYDASLVYTQTMCTARLMKASDTDAVLTTDRDIRGQAIVCIKKSGVWQPTEYVNPAMELGKEYRTTERDNGKPKYVKVLEADLPNNTTGYIWNLVPIGEEISSIDSFCGYAISPSPKSVNPMPYFTDQGALRVHCWLNSDENGYIGFRTFEDLTGWKGRFVVKYTKVND